MKVYLHIIDNYEAIVYYNIVARELTKGTSAIITISNKKRNFCPQSEIKLQPKILHIPFSSNTFDELNDDKYVIYI